MIFFALIMYTLLSSFSLLTVWHYASAILAVGLSLLQSSIVSKQLNGSSSFLVQRLSSTYPILCCEKILVSSNILVLSFPSGTFSHTNSIDLRKFLYGPSVIAMNDSHQFIMLTIHLCRQHDGRKAVHRMDSFATAERQEYVVGFVC